jgi:glycosyltransferase involved in cell wall biosynthesis
MLDQITPVLLTYNEAKNIERTFAQLTWAKDIVVVDSFSDDATISILNRFRNVRIFQREFDTHANQWNYALKETDIKTEWVLALDADYVLTNDLIEELRFSKPSVDIGGFVAEFTYCIFGQPLRSCLYPPVTVLYRINRAEYRQDGHTQRVVVAGDVDFLKGKILHDDRKPLSLWLTAQDRYTRLEANLIAEKKWHQLGWTDRLRKVRILMPLAMFIYCLIVKRLILDGRSGLYYSFQRTLAEVLLSLRLIKKDIVSQ